MVPYGAAELSASFRTVRGNTIKIAEEIPEEHYDFRPAPDTWTVAELLTHIALAPRFQYDVHETRRAATLVGYDFAAYRARQTEDQQRQRTKTELVELLRSEGERIADWLATFDDARLAERIAQPPAGEQSKTRFEMLLGLKEHEMHHRGQLMLIERMLGIVPHLTRAAQERAAAARRQREVAGA
jgi:uncharacterized damage-inducible protein DinB